MTPAVDTRATGAALEAVTASTVRPRGQRWAGAYLALEYVQQRTEQWCEGVNDD